ncbi:MAG: NAD(P)H-hydrate dehydratase [Lachnospiraceae bacterium]|jgi:NAD(P)H-hydrate epimerase|nr:NAD(P)H-hydrate dehydratase [Lachnospiraceae bacterium]
MQYIVTQEEMKRYDETTISYYKVPALTLMERAALSVVEGHDFTDRERILVLCAGGNNGGDGFAVARMLLLKGKQVTVLFCGNRDHLSESCRMQWEIYEKYAKTLDLTDPVVTQWPEAAYDIVIDAIFGVGLNREISGRVAEVIEKANRLDAYRIAVDIPSGVDADTGQIHGCAFRADVTDTFAFVKRGLLLYPGASYSGKVRCHDIGITKESFGGVEPVAFSLQPEDLSLLPHRDPAGNKGSFGKIGFFAGCAAIGGAAILSAKAAYHMGSGYVRVFTHENARAGMLSQIPEAVASYYKEEMTISERISLCDTVAEKSDVLAIGAGIGTDEWAREMTGYVLQRSEKPLVMDADACNILAADEVLKQELKSLAGMRKHPIILTPHLAEFARLSGVPVRELKKDLPQYVMQFAKEYGVILAAKDAVTLVCDGRKLYMNRSGNDGMATAGSGDVLFGMIASLAGQGLEAFEAACLGVYIHGLGGDLSAKETNARFLTASDLIGGLQKTDIRYLEEIKRCCQGTGE